MPAGASTLSVGWFHVSSAVSQVYGASLPVRPVGVVGGSKSVRAGVVTVTGFDGVESPLLRSARTVNVFGSTQDVGSTDAGTRAQLNL